MVCDQSAAGPKVKVTTTLKKCHGPGKHKQEPSFAKQTLTWLYSFQQLHNSKTCL